MTSYVFKPSRRKGGKSIHSRVYWGGYRLPGDWKEIRLSLETTDKQVAEKRLAEHLRSVQLETEGILAPKPLREGAATPLSQHLDDFINDLTAQGRDEFYVNHLVLRLKKLFAECHWTLARHISTDSFQQWRARQNLAPKTLNDYLDAARNFLGWLRRMGRFSGEPLASVSKVEVRGKERCVRRAATENELSRLFAVSSLHRCAYAAAVFTGLRRAEIEALCWGDVFLDEPEPFLVARASTTKNHKTAKISLHPQLVEELRAARPLNVQASTRIFGRGQIPRMEAMKKDLALAGIAFEDKQGRRFDFHAFRKTLNTLMARNNVDPHLRKLAMRHSDLKLTLDVYTDTTVLPVGNAIRGLSRIGQYAVPCAVDLGAEGREVAQVGTKAVNELPTQEVDLEGDIHDLARTGTDGRVQSNGSPCTPHLRRFLSCSVSGSSLSGMA